MCTQRDWLVFTERNSFYILFRTCCSFLAFLGAFCQYFCSAVQPCGCVDWTSSCSSHSFSTCKVFPVVVPTAHWLLSSCRVMCCVWRHRYIFMFGKKESHLICRIFSNLQYCISSTSVCMKIPCKLRIKRPRGGFKIFGWFCKSFQLKTNLNCELIWGLFQRARFLVKFMYKKLLLHCFFFPW